MLKIDSIFLSDIGELEWLPLSTRLLRDHQSRNQPQEQNQQRARLPEPRRRETPGALSTSSLVSTKGMIHSWKSSVRGKSQIQKKVIRSQH